MASWVLFYDDGSVVRSEDCQPADVPGWGMLCGAQEDTRPTSTSRGSWITFAGEYVYHSVPDAFWRPAQTWADIEELILFRKPIVGICKGRTVPDVVFRPIWERCRQWADERNLKRKDRWEPGERRVAGVL